MTSITKDKIFKELFKLKKKGIEFNVIKKVLAEEKHRIANYRSRNFIFILHKPEKIEFEIIKKKLDSEEVTNAIVSYEHGEKATTPHLQGFVVLKDRHYVRKWFDMKRSHVETAHKSFEANVRYVSGVSKEYELQNILYIKNIDTPSDLRPHDVIHPNKFRQWQRQLWNILNRDPHNRIIYWVYEPLGGVGKSAFCRTLSYCRGACILGGNDSAMRHGVGAYIVKTSIYPSICLIDCSRSNKDAFAFSAVEDIKNKFFFSYRLDSKEVKGKHNCHILIVSNYPPNKKEMKLLSEDRWFLMEIVSDKLKIIKCDERYRKITDVGELNEDELYNRSLVYGYDFYLKDKFIKIKSKKRIITKKIEDLTPN